MLELGVLELSPPVASGVMITSQTAAYSADLSFPTLPLSSLPVPSVKPIPMPCSDISTTTFDMSKNIVLVPLFQETEVDTYFSVFEHITTALKWPKDVWSFLLQCKLVGKAQEVCSSLSL